MTGPARIATAFGAILALVLAAVWMISSTAGAEEPGRAGPIEVELNKMEDRGGSCRLSFIFRNGTDRHFETLKLDLVMFGQDDVIARRLIVDASPMRPEKTTVKLFDLEGLPCPGIATILINDLPDCVAGGETRTDCIELVGATSRAGAALTK